MSYWTDLIESRPERDIMQFEDPPISLVCGPLVKKCSYFLVVGIGEVSHCGESQNFESRVAPTESAWAVQYENGVFEGNAGRCGMAAIDSNGSPFTQLSPFVPRSHFQSPANLVHFDSLPVWGSTFPFQRSSFFPKDVYILANRFMRLVCSPDPDFEGFDRQADLIFDLRHNIAIAYEEITDGEVQFAMNFSSVRCLVNPSDIGILEEYVN